MSPSRPPVERAFATGHQGTVLVLMICRDWLWSSLYASPHSDSPVEVCAAPSLIATAGERRLIVGGKTYPVSRTCLQSVRRWLDRNGVRVRTAPSSKSSN